MEYTLIIVCFVLVFLVISLFGRLDKLDGRVKVLQYNLEQISKHLELPENPINDELRKLIKEGKDIKAVKKARETLGLSLLEGKEYIDKLKIDDK
ncbi:hypothetical protein JOC75_000590 [Metabacillus crassostreae]|uniref:hypothetical protein n=1 Tax=Metabacillus crassostreae TaxID=929098 RepID=UPI00195608BB|nr:hypothetical protein [Metabacillus crassostreae]MBM7602620.1 hypothetical protein [Metabacillus crassostreae]